MKKKKQSIQLIKEKFIIPQINYPLEGIFRKPEEFEPSMPISPMHGSNVHDRTFYYDNAKDNSEVAKRYDFIREKKMISDDELIKKYGTKYYEFNFIDKQLSKEEMSAANYNKKAKPKATVNQPQPKKQETLNTFFVDSLEVTKKEELEPNIFDQEITFKIKPTLDAEQDEVYEYGSFDVNMPKPEPVTIPSYVIEKEKSVVKRPSEDLTLDLGELSYGEKEVKIIKEEVVTTSKQEPSKDLVKPEKPVENRYADYSIPYEQIFKKTDVASDEIPEWLEDKKEAINETLRQFHYDGEVICYTRGPAITRYEVLLAQNINVKKIRQLADNLKGAVQSKTLTMLTPIPGKRTVGIDVPNDEAETVYFGDVLTPNFFETKMPLALAFGKDLEGNSVIESIPEMPHALIAGATKSGKSVCINTILISLLLKNSPEKLRLILIDPKKVELSFYNDIPHLLTPVVDETDLAREILLWATEEMDRRYLILKNNLVRKIEDYNKRCQSNPELEKLPYIVIVVDEFNDLVMQDPHGEISDAIKRIAQKARAAGMHIILATQRPTVDVVDGTIKSNITCRIAFRVATATDSQVILDEPGAEELLGRGDMLFKKDSQPTRLQGAYISDEEIIEVCDYLRSKYQPDYLITEEDLAKRVKQSQNGSGGAVFAGKENQTEPEELLYNVAKHIVETGKCSINSIVTQFNFGWNRASRIIKILDERGIISMSGTNTSSKILVDSYELKKKFDNLFGDSLND